MSRNLLLMLGLGLALTLGACTKIKNETAVAADGSGTCKLEMAYKVEAVENVRDRIEEMALRIEEDGGDPSRIEANEERISSFVAAFEEAKVVSELKKKGFEVVGTKEIDREGWKGVHVSAKFSDINAIVAAYQAARDAEAAERDAARDRAEEEGEDDGERRGRRGRRGSRGSRTMGPSTEAPFVFAFEKTADQGIGRLVLQPKREARPEREGRGGGGRFGGGRRGGGDSEEMNTLYFVDEQTTVLRLTLPGEIVGLVNCKKDGENTVVFEVKGSQQSEEARESANTRRTEGVSATFRIPEGCKIKFTDPGAKAAVAPKTKKEGDEPRRRRGGLKVEDGDKDK